MPKIFSRSDTVSVTKRPTPQTISTREAIARHADAMTTAPSKGVTLDASGGVIPKALSKELQSRWSKVKQKTELRQLTLFVGLLTAATLGRVALQYVPSVEPIIPLAIVAGFWLGAKEGFSVGAGAYVASNFLVWGLQGPWTLFQAVGAAVPGALAGIFGKTTKPSPKNLVLFSILGTVFFEIVMNISGAVMGIGVLGPLGLFSIPLYFLTSLPFSLIHIFSNAGFAIALVPILKKGSQDHEFDIVSVSRFVGNQRTDIRLYKPKP